MPGGTAALNAIDAILFGLELKNRLEMGAAEFKLLLDQLKASGKDDLSLEEVAAEIEKMDAALSKWEGSNK